MYFVLFCFVLFCFNRPGPHRPTNNQNTSKFAQKPASSDLCPRCGKTVYAAEKVLGAGSVRTVKYTKQVEIGHHSAFWMLKVSFSVVSSGIKSAFAVPVVAKDLSRRPLLIKMEKSSVKVCVHSHLRFDWQLEFAIDISWCFHDA